MSKWVNAFFASVKLLFFKKLDVPHESHLFFFFLLIESLFVIQLGSICSLYYTKHFTGALADWEQFSEQYVLTFGQCLWKCYIVGPLWMQPLAVICPEVFWSVCLHCWTELNLHETAVPFAQILNLISYSYKIWLIDLAWLNSKM